MCCCVFSKDQVMAQREYKCVVVCSGRTRSSHRESISVLLCVQEGPGRRTERV